MITKSMYQKIQNYKKKGYLKSEIAQELKIDPGTVAKYYHMSEEEYREYTDTLKNRDKAFDGLIDDVRIYNRALSQPEISALANQ